MAFKVAIARERSIILQINELKSWLEAYRNSYLHFIDPEQLWQSTHTDTLPYTSLRMQPRHNDIHHGALHNMWHLCINYVNNCLHVVQY